MNSCTQRYGVYFMAALVGMTPCSKNLMNLVIPGSDIVTLVTKVYDAITKISTVF
jgi:hypothetical protein